MKSYSPELAKKILNSSFYVILILLNVHELCLLVTAKNQELNNHGPQSAANYASCILNNSNSSCILNNEFLKNYFHQPTICATTKNDKVITKYLLYDVNVAEGFNLRRDVYIRMAKLVNLLNNRSSDSSSWTLVLPPWPNLYHWTNNNRLQKRLKWSEFFDTTSLGYYVPVIELEKFIQINGRQVDMVYYLRSYERFEDGEWIEKADVRDCNQIDSYYKVRQNGKFKGTFWSYPKFYSDRLKCVYFQGTATFMAQQILTDKRFQPINTFMLDRAETILHSAFADPDYWACRRSMRFASKLVQKSKELRAVLLDSNDQSDRTEIDPDWRRTQKMHSNAIGGPYLAVHLRRGDFLYSRESSIVSLHKVANQILTELNRLNLTSVYVASDASWKELNELRSEFDGFNFVFYRPVDLSELYEFGDGGVAIIDQLICAHARYFIGTYESTFSFRIQEEREILGFDPSTSFNILCLGEKGDRCRSTEWLIKY